MQVDSVIAQDVNRYKGTGCLGGLVDVDGGFGGGVGGGAVIGGGMNTSEWETEHMHLSNQYNHMNGRIEMDYAAGGAMAGQNIYSRYNRADVFDGMALSDQFLEEYFASVST